MDQEKYLLRTLTENLTAFLNYFITLDISLPRLIFGLNANKHIISGEVYNTTLMQKLYSHKVIDDIHKKVDCLLYNMIELDTQFQSKNGRLSTKNLNYILNELIGNFMDEIYPDNHSKSHVGKNSVAVEIDKSSMLEYSVTDQTIRDLFIWAVLMNYIDMSKMLLAHMNHRICAALVARRILMRYRDKYIKYSDKKLECMQLMDDFENYAIDCVSLCYNNDHAKACELVLRRCKMFGNVACLQVGEIVSRKLYYLISKQNNILIDGSSCKG
jgi:hypothetical protein